MPRTRWSAVASGIATAGLVSIGLGACTAGPLTPMATAPPPSASPAPPLASPGAASGEPSPLLPTYPSDFTASTAESESLRVARELVALLPPGSVLNDDTHSQEVAATETAGNYWGVLHTITLDPRLGAAGQAKAIVDAMQQGGWMLRDTSDTDESYLAALSSSSDAARSWFVVVGADLSVKGQSVVTVQLASPNLP